MSELIPVFVLVGIVLLLGTSYIWYQVVYESDLWKLRRRNRAHEKIERERVKHNRSMEEIRKGD